jgi:hypothetical protein
MSFRPVVVAGVAPLQPSTGSCTDATAPKAITLQDEVTLARAPAAALEAIGHGAITKYVSDSGKRQLGFSERRSVPKPVTDRAVRTPPLAQPGVIKITVGRRFATPGNVT